MGRVMSGDSGTRLRSWSARGAFVFAALTAAIPILFAGVAGTLGVLIVGTGGVVVTIAALYWFLTRYGLLRWVALAIAVLTPIVVVVVFVRARLLWVVVLAVAAALLAVACARVALRARPSPAASAVPAPPARRPFLIMNPRSGGGKVEKYDLRRRAEELGAEVALLDGEVDIEELARQAVARGADLLGVAGGDGTQALVAGVAAEHDLPFLVISAGTRNHFAMDLHLDRDDPAAGLDALRDGAELRVDLGRINGLPFINNASFGVYAEIVRSPAYRDDKTATVLHLLPDLLAGHTGHRLVARIDGTTVAAPQAILVSNNPYRTGDLAGLNRRDRLDLGMLGAVTVSVAGTRDAVGLLRHTRGRGLTQHTTTQVDVDADAPQIPVGVDGESRRFDTPVRCVIERGALRVRVPRNRPSAPPAPPTIDWLRLRDLALRGDAGTTH